MGSVGHGVGGAVVVEGLAKAVGFEVLGSEVGGVTGSMSIGVVEGGTELPAVEVGYTVECAQRSEGAVRGEGIAVISVERAGDGFGSGREDSLAMVEAEDAANAGLAIDTIEGLGGVEDFEGIGGFGEDVWAAGGEQSLEIPLVLGTPTVGGEASRQDLGRHEGRRCLTEIEGIEAALETEELGSAGEERNPEMGFSFAVDDDREFAQTEQFGVFAGR